MYRNIEVEEVSVISQEQIEEGTRNDNPNTVINVRLPNGEEGWVAGPHGVSSCCIFDWLQYIGKPAATKDEAIAQGCE